MNDKFFYLDLVEKLFDFQPKLYKDTYFTKLAELADDCYIGKGSLHERINYYTQKRAIKSNQLKNLFQKALNIVRTKSDIMLPRLIPKNESVDVALVKNQNWSMYNWYLGNFHSRIDINIDRPFTWSNLLNYTCHEAYPGHHLERAIKEKMLFQKKGYYETSILLIYSPEMVISEGIGLIAKYFLFDPDESSKILLNHFCPNPEIEDDIELLKKQDKIRRGAERIESNLAFLKYVELWTNEELVNYAREFDIYSDDVINAMIEFVSDEIWSLYILAYQGERLITETFGERPSPNNYAHLLSEYVLPSDLIQ